MRAANYLANTYTLICTNPPFARQHFASSLAGFLETPSQYQGDLAVAFVSDPAVGGCDGTWPLFPLGWYSQPPTGASGVAVGDHWTLRPLGPGAFEAISGEVVAGSRS